jgi:hypothetical protein
MHPFTYSISLRIWHPRVDPRQISDALNLRPEVARKARDRRQTPAGRPLTGVHADTYWCCVIPHPRRQQLSASLEWVVERLTPSRKFLKRISQGGGSLELFVGWYSDTNSGEEFSWKLLRKLAGLHIDLSLDVYAALKRPASKVTQKHAPDP